MAPKDLASDPLDFLSGLTLDRVPEDVRHHARRSLLDTLGIAMGGLATRLSRIVRDHAAEDLPGPAPMLFDNRTAARSAAAMAAGMTIDSLDGHDGFNPAKGHIGAPLFSGLLVEGHAADASGRAMMEAIIAGYELGGRASLAQHATCPDYHTSGSWGAVTVAAAGARLRGLDRAATRHALGIAEYHGPRSQMMRCIDHPTMLKDGAGWGALCGISALDLAARGFTGAPALTIEQAPDFFADLGSRWILREQYFKPYPVCRWAQAPVEAALALCRQHGLTGADVVRIEVETFHEACRLATVDPETTEEAQYSTAFPVAVALARGAVTPADIADDALEDPEVQRLARSLTMREHAHANTTFPVKREARVALHLQSGQIVHSDWTEPLWSHDAPPSDGALIDKYHSLADPVVGTRRAHDIRAAVWDLEEIRFSDLARLLFTAP